ncbi:MAG: PEP-CTERM sorting domain-containing protein [Planctomycetota bacterium]|nr:PEP-CTERM sorting domain-containing protein [Planctomycetota bacterium]
MRASLIALVVAVLPAVAFADPILGWTFDDPTPTVGPFETVIMNATLTNDAAADMNFLGADVDGGAWTHGTISGGGPYVFTFGPAASFFPQFSGLILAPGDSFSFVFGTLTPVGGGPVAPGMYTSLPGGRIGFFIQPTGRFLVQVTDGPFTVTVVPEPSISALLCAGLGLFFLRRRKRAA